jgi:indole-3-glycerol phosphate synthase
VSEVPDILLRIREQRRRRVAPDGPRLEPGSACGSAAARLAPDASGHRFLDAISARRGNAVIAEIKMGSPKLGDLRGRFDPVARARTYADAGAACLSVVVEPDHFHGSYDLLAECAAASGLPAVAKDFVVSDVQLAWARDAGASAVLLIAALYDAEELRRLAGLARGLGLVPLIETHDDADFEKLRPITRGERGEQGADERLQQLRAGGPDPRPRLDRDRDWELVGINNRDLRTFEVDLERSADRVDCLPSSALKVAESGIQTGADVANLRRAGFDAFLIGERLVLSGDPAAALSELLGAPASPPASGAMPQSGEPELKGPGA